MRSMKKSHEAHTKQASEMTLSVSAGKVYMSAALLVPVVGLGWRLLSDASAPSSWVAWVAAAVACVLPLLLSRRSTRRLPPSPISFPVFGNWLQVGNDLNHRYLASMAGKLGGVFLLRLGVRNLVVVSEPELAAEVLHGQGVEFGSRPRNVVFDIFTGEGQDMVFAVYGEHWRKMRRIMTLPFFTNKVVQEYRGMWEEEVQRVVEELGAADGYGRKASTEGVLVRRRLQLMLYNVMYGMMFDAKFESVEDPMFKQATLLNSERSRLAQSFDYNYGDFIPILRPFLAPYLNKCRELHTRRLAFFNDHYIQKRRAALSPSAASNVDAPLKCAVDHILEAERSGEISADNVLYMVENINVAALGTTLRSMEWGIAELVNHPHVQHKLRAEIRSLLPAGTPITESHLHALPYLQAVVKETLRLHTPVPLLVPHMNLQEARLGGYHIPKESKVVVNAWWLANNPEWWKAPEELRPERFLQEEGATQAVATATATAKGVDFRYLPFGVGRRSCPGIILALPLLGLVLANLVSNFDMLPPPGTDTIDVAEKGGQFTLHLAHHSTVVFRPIHP